MNDIIFWESIKIKPDREKEMLIKIQDEIEKNGRNKEKILELIKKLSDSQKIQLKQLYSEQIKELDFSIEQYRRKIIKIRSNLERLKKA